jgi:hypothetical protein
VNAKYSIPTDEEAPEQSMPPPSLPPSIFDLPVPEECGLYISQVPWVVPPPIRFTDDKGWTKWEMEADEEGRDCVVQKGKKFDFDRIVYYDWK